EGRGENSPGWSVAQSGECAAAESARPVGAERAAIVPSSDVHAIALSFLAGALAAKLIPGILEIRQASGVVCLNAPR
ncbi:MAG TPA: hypothetical protein VMQ56_16930, partial [Terracidiphilus sp.]|nr:hypothetical protein [Terracidiphilus sp.]